MPDRDRYTLLHGDVLDQLRAVPDNTFHGMLTDPPYGLGFMGKRWDHEVPSALVWREALRVLRPGAHALVFGGTRTWHRLAVALEDAGFELRDTLMWLYGSGFPKSHDVSKAIDKAAGAQPRVVGHADPHSARTAMARGIYGTALQDEPGEGTPITEPATPDAQCWNGYGTALKPAWEPVLLVRKPPAGTVAANAIEQGAGALNIDDARIAFRGAEDEAESKGKNRHAQFGTRHGGNNVYGDYGNEVRDDYDPPGRWPANALLDEAAAAQLDAQSGVTTSGAAGRKGSSGFAGGYDGQHGVPYGDTGGASRFFYVAKAGRREREAGLDALPEQAFAQSNAGKAAVARGEEFQGADASTGLNRVKRRRNTHPTVKPLDLARYLATLIRPPVEDAHLLVPFSGSGSEVIGGLMAGWPRVTGVELEAEYIQIAHARIVHHADAIRDGGSEPDVPLDPPGHGEGPARVQPGLFDALGDA